MWLYGFILLLWAISGAGSFIFWWTHDDDVTTREIPLVILCSIIGPFSAIGGILIHGGGKTIIKERKF